MAKFEVGQVYCTRSSADWDSVYSWTVVSRTEKQLVLRDASGRETRRGVRVWEGVESCRPLGSYSMCPVIMADRPGPIG